MLALTFVGSAGKAGLLFSQEMSDDASFSLLSSSLEVGEGGVSMWLLSTKTLPMSIPITGAPAVEVESLIDMARKGFGRVEDVELGVWDHDFWLRRVRRELV